MEASITLKSLAKKNDTSIILADLSLGIEQGAVHALIGQNGSGKSTLLKIIAGLTKNDAGKIYINGKDIDVNLSEVKSMVGYVPDYIDFDQDLSIYDNLLVSGALFGLTDKEVKTHIVKFSDIFSFRDKLLLYPHDLSTGVLRSLQLVRAMLHNPEILILDEPTLGMDLQNKLKFWNVIQTLCSEKTVLFTTQDLYEPERYADRISILHHGNIMMDGSLDRLIGATNKLLKFQINFVNNAPDQILDKIKSLNSVLKPEVNGRTLEFYSSDRKIFFKVLKAALEYEIHDIDMSFFRLFDLYLGLVHNGIE